jgi:hypothetical protein
MRLWPGGGESCVIWRLGPCCIKRWSSRDSATEVRLSCRVFRIAPACNRMWYVPWLHRTLARWVVGEPASHEACNRLLARFPGLRDLHPANVIFGRRGAVVVNLAPGAESNRVEFFRTYFFTIVAYDLGASLRNRSSVTTFGR